MSEKSRKKVPLRLKKLSTPKFMGCYGEKKNKKNIKYFCLNEWLSFALVDLTLTNLHPVSSSSRAMSILPS